MFNKATSVKVSLVDTSFFSVKLVKGYNYITNGIPTTIKTGEFIGVVSNAAILTYATSDEEDLACAILNCWQSSCDLDCSKSPTGFRFGIKMYTSNDSLTNQVTLTGNYTKCGKFDLNATASFYSTELVNSQRKSVASTLHVLCSNESTTKLTDSPTATTLYPNYTSKYNETTQFPLDYIASTFEYAASLDESSLQVLVVLIHVNVKVERKLEPWLKYTSQRIVELGGI